VNVFAPSVARILHRGHIYETEHVITATNARGPDYQNCIWILWTLVYPEASCCQYWYLTGEWKNYFRQSEEVGQVSAIDQVTWPTELASRFKDYKAG